MRLRVSGHYTNNLEDQANRYGFVDATAKIENLNIADVKKHETAGEALVFAPSKELKMSTYARDEKLEQELYDLGISDFNARLKELHTFLS